MCSVTNMVTHWTPFGDLSSETCDKPASFAVLILNTPISFNSNTSFIKNIWNKAKVRITVDGGTHRWLQWLQKHDIPFCSVPAPDLITGDMDSLPEEILRQFSEQHPHIRIIKTPDQDRTDFVKALCELKTHCNDNNIALDNIYVIVDTCGRLDQILANINALFKSASIVNETRVFLVADTSLTWLLAPGTHSICIPERLRDAQDWCAMIPIGNPCTLTTTGLKWNLTDFKSCFGGMVSSSNTYDGSPCVTITTDNPLVWSMSISKLF